MSTTLQREGGLTVALSLTVNVIMAGAKLSVGTIASSQALVADGIHSLVDIAGDIAAIIGLKFAHLPKDDDHPYGHHRFSTLATMLISSLVLLFCLGLAWRRCPPSLAVPMSLSPASPPPGSLAPLCSSRKVSTSMLDVRPSASVRAC